MYKACLVFSPIKHVTIYVKKKKVCGEISMCVFACFHQNHRIGKPDTNEDDHL